MNGSYFQNPTFPTAVNPNNNNMDYSGQYNYEEGYNAGAKSVLNDGEQSYIENILRLNKGKRVKAYVSFPDSNDWRDKVFDGIIEEAGRDHLILSNPQTGEWYMILMIYLNYVVFNDQINYSHSYSEKTF